MKAAIIGANGYIGRHISYYLRRTGWYVSCYDVSGPDCVNVDMTDRLSVEKIDFDVDTIFMFAGLTGTYAGFDKYETYVNINEITLLNLLNAIRLSPFRPRIVFPSSRLVYKDVEYALRENDEKETKTIYAVNKLACEGYLYAYSNSFEIPFTIVRICVPFGNLLGNDYSFGTLGFMIRQAQTKKEITLYGTGKVRRTFTSMGDLCKQIVNIATSSEGINDVYNIGGVTYSLVDVADVVAQRYGAKLSFVDYPTRDLLIESGSTFFDSSKIEGIIGSFKYEDISLLF